MKLIDDLENILNSLKEIDENKFDTEFNKIKNKMISAKKEAFELEKSGFLEQNPKLKEKINLTAKLISEEYDNKISLWKSRINEISEMLIFSRNEKKILSYKR